MPTATFFRLPEEKRRRLLDACWSELTGVRFTDVSINRIITEAHIPRGSFYQYFSDKEDLIHYLLDNMREYFISLLQGILVEARGDLFAMPLMAYDRFFSQRGDTDVSGETWDSRGWNSQKSIRANLLSTAIQLTEGFPIKQEGESTCLTK